MKKKCTKCGIIKDLSEFHVDRQHKDGHDSKCKACKNKSDREHYKNNREELRRRAREYRRNNREELNLQVRAFYKNNREKECQRVKKYNENNKEKRKQYSDIYCKKNREKLNQSRRDYYKNNQELEKQRRREYYKNNKEKEKQYEIDYYKTPNGKAAHVRGQHKRRAHKKNLESSLTTEQWLYILKNQNNHCNICGKKFTAKRQPTQDHIIPLKHNGNYSSDNIQALCPSCNSSKNAGLDKQFIQVWSLI